MKKVKFELTDSVYRRWLNYKKKHNFSGDSGALYQLLTTPSPITYTEKKILDVVYDAVWVILDSAIELREEHKEIELSVSYELCTCEGCQKEKYAAHIDEMKCIRVSRRYFLNMLGPKIHVPIGLLSLMYKMLHEILHGLYPELSEEEIVKKTEQVWKKGMLELASDL